MSEVAKRQFVRQQGFDDVPVADCACQHSALMFQPRLLAVFVLLAILLQSAALFLSGAGLAFLGGWPSLSWILQGVVAIALGALVLGRFCLGSYLYHLLRGDTSFANRTLPWSRAD